MSRNEYSLFIAVADSLSYTRAAKRLGVHATSVSRGVERLETRLGLNLVETGAEGLRLTEAGERLSAFVAPLLDTLDHGVAALCRDVGGGGVLRIAAPPEILISCVNPIVREMLSQNPALRVSLEASVSLPDFKRAECDIFLSHRRDEMNEGDYRIRRIGMYDIALFASPELLAIKGHPLIPQDLASFPCLTRPGEQAWTLMPVEGVEGPLAREPIDIPLDSRIAATPAPIRLDFACAGSGIIAASRELCAVPLAEGRLVRVLPAYRLPSGTLYAAQPVRHHTRPVAEAFLTHLVERLKLNRKQAEALEKIR
ncbi:LysR family transcriptional regulator [Asaia platycodi]|uniref:LysR family transcriptional regulator n=1 Tax=Asaia platycodi TaxID=610243 RepID=UPI00047196F0|nr:LysR family transcriptional regulator [Asaia platycodi]